LKIEEKIHIRLNYYLVVFTFISFR